MLRTEATLIAVALTLGLSMPARSGTITCPNDSVKVGSVCIDKYEASVWAIDPTNTKLVKKVQSGKATLADLNNAGAMQLAPAGTCKRDGEYGTGFPSNGSWTPIADSKPPSPGVYAVSIPGVLPSACITWFQADQACLLSGKRLLSNREWQGAAAGTPDPGTDNGTSDCDVNSMGPTNTGSRSNCKSSWGVFDMVGNVQEWVADWTDQAAACTDWTAAGGLAGDDSSCFGGPANDRGLLGTLPAALLRGGAWSWAENAGPLNVNAGFAPSTSFNTVGFRCAR